jgi:hypothetical protein
MGPDGGAGWAVAQQFRSISRYFSIGFANGRLRLRIGTARAVGPRCRRSGGAGRTSTEPAQPTAGSPDCRARSTRSLGCRTGLGGTSSVWGRALRSRGRGVVKPRRRRGVPPSSYGGRRGRPPRGAIEPPAGRLRAALAMSSPRPNASRRPLSLFPVDPPAIPPLRSPARSRRLDSVCGLGIAPGARPAPRNTRGGRE